MIKTVRAAITLGTLLTLTAVVLACGDESTCGEELLEVVSSALSDLNKKYDFVPEGKVVQQVIPNQGGHTLSSKQAFRLVPKLKANAKKKKGGFGSVTKGLGGGGGMVLKVTIDCETDGCMDTNCDVRGCQPTANGCSACRCVSGEFDCSEGACKNCKYKSQRSWIPAD